MSEYRDYCNANYGPEDIEDGPEPGAECGRWRNARLAQYCTKAGTEECDFECPYRDAECVKC